MTTFFVKKFKAAHECHHCSESAKRGRKFCDKHLTAAKMKFRSWSAERRSAGRCILCERQGFRGELRCVTHKVINRKRCARWMAAHPHHGREQWLLRLKLRAQGICLCYARGKLEPGQRRCSTCIARRPEYLVAAKAAA
jgi:hypothetical protein